MALPSSKASGYDKVPVSEIKYYLEHTLPTITGLSTNHLPIRFFACLEKGEVVPHLKCGDHEVSNNRPISLLPLLSKVAERIALGQFNNYLTQETGLTCHQSGNREHH